jgi:hypothetical protein
MPFPRHDAIEQAEHMLEKSMSIIANDKIGENLFIVLPEGSIRT